MKQKKLKNKAYLIVGFIGAGKTTYAKKVETRTGALRFTKDEWVIKIFGHDPTIKNFDKYDNIITNLATETAIYCLKSGNDVIIDDGFWFKSQRDEIKKRINKLGAKAEFHYLKCNKEIMKKRTCNRNNKLSPDSFKISEQLFEKYWKYFEEPTNKEAQFIVSNN